MSGPSFRIAGIPVRVDLTFLLLAFLLGWGARSGGLLVAWMVIVFVSVLLHELGHAVAFRRFGQEPQILLQGMGGLTSGSGEPLPPRRDIVVSLAGPLTGMVLLGLPALALARSAGDLSGEARTILSDIVFVNVAWSVLNLLPILPLDGGRVTAALLSLRSPGTGLRQAHLLSAAVAGAAAAWAGSAGNLFGAMFAGFFCAYNVSQLSARRNATLEERIGDGWRALARGDARRAQEAAQAALAERPSAATMTHARELLAWARLAEGDADGAEAALARLPHGKRPSPSLQAALHLEAGHSDEALDDLVTAYESRDFSPATPAVIDTVVRADLLDALVERLLAQRAAGPSAVALLGVHLHATNRFSDATRIGRRALEAGADNPGRIAYNVACSEARAGDPHAALAWLERAADLGFRDVALLDEDSDLDTVRGDERFLVLRRRLEGVTPGAQPAP